MLLAISLANAGTLVVAKTGGHADSIQAAVDIAASGDTIQVEAGTWDEAVVIDGKDLSIVSEGGSAATLIDAGELGSFAVTVSGASLQIEGFTIENGDQSGIYVNSGGDLVAVDLVFDGLGDDLDGGDYFPEDYGGAILLHTSSGRISSSSFTGGQAYEGGHIAVFAGSLDVVESSFEGGSAVNGGAIYASSATVTLEGCTFYDNDVDESGGALYADGSTLTVTDSAFEDNTLYSNYGAAMYLEGTPTTITGTTFAENTATYGYGGAIWATYGASLDISDSEFVGNLSYRSGGAISVYYNYSTLTVRDTVFDDNFARYGYGGAIYGYVEASMEFERVDFLRNRAAYHGGGLYNYYYGEVHMTDVVFADNEVDYYSGGGAYLYYLWTGKTSTLTNVRFEGNDAGIEGGGLFALYLDVFELREVEFVSNAGEVGLYGGGMYASGINTLVVHDSVFANNHATYGGGFYEAGGGIVSHWTNTVVQENSARVGGGGCFVDSAPTTFINNGVLGNVATDDGSALCLYEARHEFTNNLFAYNTGAEAIVGFDLNSGFYSTFEYNGWWDNPEGHTAEELTAQEWFSEGSVEVDPMLVAFSIDGDLENDSLVLVEGSELIDAGDPNIWDPDESRSDIGAYGGPAVGGHDADGDGFSYWQDCDDEDASVHPGADDEWYDGVDSDCDGVDDMDADGDGIPAEEDCDDADASLFEDCVTDDGTPIDGDETPGAKDPEDPGGCSVIPVGGAWFLGLLVFARRR